MPSATAATASRSPAASGLLPMPGSPAASWVLYKARLSSIFQSPNTSVFIAFWLFGCINNVLFVIILSAAQDVVGSAVPKGLVLIADILPAFLFKLVAPYFIHRIPYATRIVFFAFISTLGMLMVALTPREKSVSAKMVGVMFASLASGGGELSFLGMIHYYGHISLAAWGSGTGAAGLVGAGLYVLMTEWARFSVRSSLLASASLPVVMLLSFFLVLPRGPLRESKSREYEPIPDLDDAEPRRVVDDDESAVDATSGLLTADVEVASATSFPAHGANVWSEIVANFRRTKALFVPFMLPLLLVYIAEYVINQGVAPTLLFPLNESPFDEYRDFYPMYAFLYQVGAFIARTSIAFMRLRRLYIQSFLQIGNLVLLTLHSLFNFIPNVYVVFLIIFWEGLLGGSVYVHTFASILETVPHKDREFSMGATSVSDSAGICVAGFVGMAVEVWLCNYQVDHGRDWCKKIQVGQ